MAFKRYDPKVKESIMKAATDARAAGKTWAEAHAAAKEVGYKGSPEGLDVMIRNASAKKSSAPKAAKPAKGKPQPATKVSSNGKSSGMPMRYAPEAKAAFIKAATDARDSGKSWAQAHKAAKAAGYPGRLQAIIKMVRASDVKGKAKPKPQPAKAVAQMGRPTSATSGSEVDPVKAMIDQIVKKRIKAVVEKAIEELRKAVD